MAKFRIQSHGRLQEWVAEEKGYFKEEGLDYEFLVKPIATWSSNVESTESAPAEVQRGAFESIEDGRGCDLSLACHWTVNMAASAGHGKMYTKAYAVTPSGIYVAPESQIKKPRDLAQVPVTVGYHSGSHFSTLQNLEKFLKSRRDQAAFCRFAFGSAGAAGRSESSGCEPLWGALLRRGTVGLSEDCRYDIHGRPPGFRGRQHGRLGALFQSLAPCPARHRYGTRDL